MENFRVWWTGSNDSKYLMDFTVDPPRLIQEGIGQTRSIEGTAVYTTPQGELLLYTDGNVIFEGRSHKEIGRGVGGNPSSTEAALIVPAPGGDPVNDFYVFGNSASTRGEINYTRVDLREASIGGITELDGGLLFGESLGTVPHANGVDFWILSVTHQSPALNAYLITADGVSSQAVSVRLPDLSEDASAHRGSIVYHPPTGRLAVTLRSSEGPRIYTADFDEESGLASSFQRFDHGGYGVAFSPDATKIYYADSYRGAFWQLDPTTAETNQVASGTWAMPRLGPDGKIYVVAYNDTAMGVIENPDADFESLRWDPSEVELPEGAKTSYSLPNQVYAPCIVNYPDMEQATHGNLLVSWDRDDRASDSVAPEILEIVLDMSGSMWGQIEGRAKYEIAREIVATTVRRLPEDVQAGVRVYSHRTGGCTDSELMGPIGGQGRGDLAERIESLQPGEGMTPIGYSLERVAEDLRALDGSKAIVLVSDGLETCDGDPVAAARSLCGSGIGVKVHTVGFDVGSESEAVKQLEEVASAGCGQFFPAAGGTELQRALQAAGGTAFTVTDPDTGESWTGSIGAAEPTRLSRGSYRLTLQTDPPVELGAVEIAAGSTTRVQLVETEDGVQRADDR